MIVYAHGYKYHHIPQPKVTICIYTQAKTELSHRSRQTRSIKDTSAILRQPHAHKGKGDRGQKPQIRNPGYVAPSRSPMPGHATQKNGTYDTVKISHRRTAATGKIRYHTSLDPPTQKTPPAKARDREIAHFFFIDVRPLQPALSIKTIIGRE